MNKVTHLNINILSKALENENSESNLNAFAIYASKKKKLPYNFSNIKYKAKDHIESIAQPASRYQFCHTKCGNKKIIIGLLRSMMIKIIEYYFYYFHKYTIFAV